MRDWQAQSKERIKKKKLMQSHDSKLKRYTGFTGPFSLEATDIIRFCVYSYVLTYK